MSSRSITRPIFIIGAPRSGTTLLGWIFEAHPDVAFWPEPRLVWEMGNQNRPDDVLTEVNATNKVAGEIDRRFAAFLADSGRSRFAEKTPSNLLRVRFLHAIYPDCRIIFLEREPLAPIWSMAKFESRRPDGDRIWARLRELRLADLPGLVRRIFRRQVGPRPPEWQSWRTLPQPVRLARQWRALMETAQQDLESIPAENWIRIDYADLIADPEAIVDQMFDFAELKPIKLNELTLREPIEPERATPDIPADFSEAVRRELADN